MLTSSPENATANHLLINEVKRSSGDSGDWLDEFLSFDLKDALSCLDVAVVLLEEQMPAPGSVMIDRLDGCHSPRTIDDGFAIQLQRVAKDLSAYCVQPARQDSAQDSRKATPKSASKPRRQTKWL